MLIAQHQRGNHHLVFQISPPHPNLKTSYQRGSVGLMTVTQKKSPEPKVCSEDGPSSVASRALGSSGVLSSYSGHSNLFVLMAFSANSGLLISTSFYGMFELL